MTEPILWKKFLIWRYSRKRLQIGPKSVILIFFSKTALTIFLVFGLKLVLNMNFNLNDTCFSEKFAIWGYLTSKSSKSFPNLGFWHFLDFASLVFLILHIVIDGHDSTCFFTICRSSKCILVLPIWSKKQICAYPKNWTYLKVYAHPTLDKKWSFPLRISSVNVTKSAVSCGLWLQLLKKSLMEKLDFLCSVSTLDT